MSHVLKREFHSRSKFFACLLTFCAGFIDAYTYIERGGTLVAGQTGNVVFLSVDLVGHSIEDAEAKLATMIAFMLGIFLLTISHSFMKQSLWRLASLLPLIVVCIVVGFLPTSIPNILVVPPISFCMGLVTTAFSKVDGIVYNNSFMTGNIKKTIVAFGHFTRTKEKSYLKEGFFFVALLSSFIGGAIVSAYLVQGYGLKTIWIAAAILLIFVIFRLTQYRSFKKATKLE